MENGFIDLANTSTTTGNTNAKAKPTHELVVKVPTADGRTISIGRIGLFANNKLHQKLIGQKDMSKILSLISRGDVEVVLAGSDTSADIELDW